MSSKGFFSAQVVTFSGESADGADSAFAQLKFVEIRAAVFPVSHTAFFMEFLRRSRFTSQTPPISVFGVASETNACDGKGKVAGREDRWTGFFFFFFLERIWMSILSTRGQIFFWGPPNRRWPRSNRFFNGEGVCTEAHPDDNRFADRS